MLPRALAVLFAALAAGGALGCGSSNAPVKASQETEEGAERSEESAQKREEQAELSKVEKLVLSQGTEESIAPELAAILGLGSDRLPVKLKSYRTTEGINLTFAVSTDPKQEGIVISALKTIAEKMEIYSVGTAWLTDRSGTLRQTIAVDASGAKVLPNSSHAAKFKDTKDFFIKKLQATSATTTLSPSPRISATAAARKKEIK